MTSQYQTRNDSADLACICDVRSGCTGLPGHSPRAVLFENPGGLGGMPGLIRPEGFGPAPRMQSSLGKVSGVQSARLTEKGLRVVAEQAGPFTDRPVAPDRLSLEIARDVAPVPGGRI